MKWVLTDRYRKSSDLSDLSQVVIPTRHACFGGKSSQVLLRNRWHRTIWFQEWSDLHSNTALEIASKWIVDNLIFGPFFFEVKFVSLILSFWRCPPWRFQQIELETLKTWHCDTFWIAASLSSTTIFDDTLAFCLAKQDSEGVWHFVKRLRSWDSVCLDHILGIQHSSKEHGKANIARREKDPAATQWLSSYLGLWRFSDFLVFPAAVIEPLKLDAAISRADVLCQEPCNLSTKEQGLSPCNINRQAFLITASIYQSFNEFHQEKQVQLVSSDRKRK